MEDGDRHARSRSVHRQSKGSTAKRRICYWTNVLLFITLLIFSFLSLWTDNLTPPNLPALFGDEETPEYQYLGPTPRRSREMCEATERRRYVKAVCEKNNWTTPEDHLIAKVGNHLLVDDRNKVMYCFIPKVACTAFKGLLIAANAPRIRTQEMRELTADNDPKPLMKIHGGLGKGGIRKLKSYSPDEIQTRLDTYFKFIVVRHPFGRLLSAYLDKVEFWRNISRIFPVFRRAAKQVNQLYNVSRDMYKDGNFQAVFPEFVHLLSLGYGSWFTSDHWETYEAVCSPCDIEYDSILKLETLDRDIELILSKLSQPGATPPPLLDLNRMTIPSNMERREEKLKSRFKPVSAETIEKLKGIYHKDFELFGYSWDAKEHDHTCGYDVTNMGLSRMEKCC